MSGFNVPEHPKYGIYDYNDAATVITPITVAAETWTTLTNDALGANTYKYKWGSIYDIWDASTNSFDFSKLRLGDSVDIRVQLAIITDHPDTTVDVSLFAAQGSGIDYSIPVITERTYKKQGTKDILESSFLYIGNEQTKLYPAQLKIYMDNTGSVVVNGWACRLTGR